LHVFSAVRFVLWHRRKRFADHTVPQMRPLLLSSHTQRQPNVTRVQMPESDEKDTTAVLWLYL
jgi:hypothetical protein